jgi:hypothetical protein
MKTRIVVYGVIMIIAGVIVGAIGAALSSYFTITTTSPYIALPYRIIGVPLAFAGVILLIVGVAAFIVGLVSSPTVNVVVSEKRDAPKVLAICPKCHSRIPSENKFCPECGANLTKKTRMVK